jgi:hypothetical protein
MDEEIFTVPGGKSAQNMLATAAAATTAASALFSPIHSVREEEEEYGGGGGGGEEEGNEKRNRTAGKWKRHASPIKKATALSAFVACLTFLIIALSLLIAFFTDLIQNDKMWSSLYVWMNRNRNCSYASIPRNFP